MKKLIATMLLALPLTVAYAAGDKDYTLDSAPVDLGNERSLQRGAKHFVNHCMGCHSLKYLRYNRMGADLGLSDEQVRDNLAIKGAGKGDLMEIAMNPEDAKNWFGGPAPDLTLATRRRKHGSDWVYTYLRSFYKASDRTFGVNNVVLPGASMPHVLQDMQGVLELVDDHGEGHGDSHGKAADGTVKIAGKTFKLVEPGSMTLDEYDNMIGDITNFMTYAAEPIRKKRVEMGMKVMAFLFLFFIVAYFLNKEFWRDVH